MILLMAENVQDAWDLSNLQQNMGFLLPTLAS